MHEKLFLYEDIPQSYRKVIESDLVNRLDEKPMVGLIDDERRKALTKVRRVLVNLDYQSLSDWTDLMLVSSGNKESCYLDEEINVALEWERKNIAQKIFSLFKKL